MSTPLQKTACLHCDGTGLELTPDGQVRCKYCGTVNTLPGTVCPRCEHVNGSDAEFCDNCQRILFRDCPNCKARNWIGSPRCTQCHYPLDALNGLIGRLQEDTDSRLYRQQRESAGLKALEEQAAERRLEQLRSIDQRREQAQDEAMAQRARQERRITTAVLVIVGLAVIVVLGIVILGLVPR